MKATYQKGPRLKGFMWLFAITLLISGKAGAQSISWAAEGKEIIKKVSETEYAQAAPSYVSYRLENGALWIFNGDERETLPRGYFKQSGEGRLFFYNNDNGLVGYYVSAEKRYYHAVGKNDAIIKEAPFAVLLDGKVYESDDSPRYTVGEGISPTWLGFFLFLM